jgi:DNA-binding FadR family transcriptional regulator
MLNDVTFHDVWEALAVVEPELAALAAQRHADEALGRLEAPHAAFAASPAGDVGSVALVGEFFDALALASGNRVLALAAQPLIQLLEPSLAQVIDRVPQARGRIHDAQRHIVAAIRARDAAEARTWMTRHVGDFRRGFELAGIAPGQAVGAAREPDAAQAD